MSTKLKPDYLIIVGRRAVTVADTQKYLAVYPVKGGIAETVSTVFPEKVIKPRSKIIVLSDEIFRQNVRLPSVQVEGLSRTELESALCYEIEPFSNISEKNGIIAFEKSAPAENDAVFDVLQISTSEFAEISRVVEAAGCRLLAVGGLPEGWTVETEPSDLAEFVSSVAAGTSRIPFVKKESGGIVPENPLPIAALLACIVAVICGIDCIFMKTALSRLRPDILRRSALAASNQALLSEISAVNAECSRLKKSEEDRKTSAEKTDRISAAWFQMFVALSAVPSDIAVISSVNADESFRCRINAVSATVEGAGRYMMLLNERLKNTGWVLAPGGLSNSASGSSVVFSFTLSYPEMAVNSNDPAVPEQW